MSGHTSAAFSKDLISSGLSFVVGIVFTLAATIYLIRKMSWSDVATEKLINLYRGHPCLYNNRMKEYRDQTVKKQAYQVIMNALQDVRRGTTVEQIKTKIGSLRGAYSQDYAKMNSNPKYKSNKWYFPLLDGFLKDFTRNASRERNRSASRDSVSEIDSTVDGDNTRDSFLMRSNMSTPLSFYGVNIGRESPVFTSRGRSGFPSPAPSLYGQEAEGMMGEDVTKPPQSRSCESVSSEGSPFFTIPKTLSAIDPSIFDQVTLLDMEVSSSPTRDVVDSGVFEQSNRVSFVPSPNLSPIPKDDSVNMQNSSPVRKLFQDGNELQISCKVVDNQKDVDKKDKGKKDKLESDFQPRPSTSKDCIIEKEMPVSKSVEAQTIDDGPASCSALTEPKSKILEQPGSLVVEEKNDKNEDSLPESSSSATPPKIVIEESHCQENALSDPSRSDSATTSKTLIEEPRYENNASPGLSRLNSMTAPKIVQEDPIPGPSRLKPTVEEVSRQEDCPPGPSGTKNVTAPKTVEKRGRQEDSSPGSSKTVPEKVNEDVQPGPSRTNLHQHETSVQQACNKQKTPKRKPFKTVHTYYEDSGSETEYFSAEEDPSPVKKKRKVAHVSHYYYPSPQKSENEREAFINFIRFKLLEVENERLFQVQTKMLSAFARD